MAERLLAGEVLNRQVQDVHPGYLSLLHAGAFAAFGVDLLSLRYPLIAASLVQAGLVFRLFGARLGAGLVASLGVTVLGLLGFLDPTANWYCLLLLVALATALGARRGRTRLLVVGLLLGLLALFRQLSGAFALAGVLACLLVEEAGEDRRGIWLGRALIATAALGLALYLARAADPWGWLFFGIWPVLALGWIAGTARVPDRRVLEMLGPLALGALAASLPLFLYHLATGSLGAWLQDVTSGAFALSRLEFRRRWLYGPLALDSLGALLSGQVAPTLDAIHWLVLLLAAAGNGVFVLRALRSRRRLPVLSLLAVAYAPVALYYQIPVYLHYTAGLSLVGLVLASADRIRLGPALLALTAVVVAIGLRFHAGMPLTGPADLVPAQPLPRVHLRIEPAERQRYLDLVRLIQRETGAGEAIFALPNHPELYFLSQRRNPFRFFNTALASADDLRRAARTLVEEPPRLVIFNSADKYGTITSDRLMETILTRYSLLQTSGDFQIYRRR